MSNDAHIGRSQSSQATNESRFFSFFSFFVGLQSILIGWHLSPVTIDIDHQRLIVADMSPDQICRVIGKTFSRSFTKWVKATTKKMHEKFGHDDGTTDRGTLPLSPANPCIFETTASVTCSHSKAGDRATRRPSYFVSRVSHVPVCCYSVVFSDSILIFPRGDIHQALPLNKKKGAATSATWSRDAT